MNNYKEYKNLLLKTYDDAVEFLLQKYGSAKDDYYREKSYQRYMNGEIKSITKGKYSRTSEGLYCHHIDENKFLNLTDTEFIIKQNVPFKHHRKDRLVYCDLIEHTILHALIAKETYFNLGFPGYSAYLKLKIMEWYFDKNIPSKEWEKNCYYKSFLNPEEAFNILKEIEKMLKPFIERANEDLTEFQISMLKIDLQYLEKYNNIADYYAEKEKRKIKAEEQYQQRRDEWLKDREKQIKSVKELDAKSPRDSIVWTAFNIKHPEYFEPWNPSMKGKKIITFEEFDENMAVYTKQEILKELVKNLDEYIDKLNLDKIKY